MTASMSASAGSAQIPQGRDLHLEIVGGRPHLESQEGQPLALVEAAGDSEIEEATVPSCCTIRFRLEVAVEDAVEECPLQEGDEAGAEHRGGVDAAARIPAAFPQANRGAVP